ncbi:hypothetical protein ACWCOP_13795 [Maricaulaceae bacterium MS644]
MIIAILREQEPGVRAAQVRRPHGVGTIRVSKWSARLSGGGLTEAKLLHLLEEENDRPKRLFVDPMLDNTVSKDFLGTNW